MRKRGAPVATVTEIPLTYWFGLVAAFLLIAGEVAWLVRRSRKP